MSKGTVIWLTGLSGAGKTTLASALKYELIAAGHRIETLDGDEVRENLSRGLGFSKADRDTNVRRIGFVARLLARNGVIVLASAISPYRQSRDDVRQSVESDGARFVEVFVRAPLAVLVGPEGGFADDERAALLRSPNVVRLALGPRILRADTAAVAALTLVGSVLGDWR